MKKLNILLFLFLSIVTHFAIAEDQDSSAVINNCISGKYPKKDIDPALIEKGLKHYSEECEMDNPSACYKLGQFYFHAKEKLIPKEVKEPMKLAREFMQKSCDFNFSRACFVLGKFLRKEFKEEEEEKLAKNLTEKSCKLENAYGCSALADYYFETRLKDSKYQEYISLSCKLGLGRNCYELSRLLTEKKAKEVEVYNALKMGCELSHKRSCKKLEEFKGKDI